MTSLPKDDFVRTANPGMCTTIRYARKVAITPYPVLITGETGTGKDVMARAIHAASGCTGQLAAINCAAIPEQLFEAELFGAERGAYTGLDSERKGLFRLCDAGTLFLDEIAEMPLVAQAKLLRVLQDGEVRPLGSTSSYRVKTRIIAATHKDLEAAARAGAFRLDLYFRISAATLALPALRERNEDIPELLRQAVDDAARVQGLAAPPAIAPSAIACARSYPWPGNVRELMHAVATALLRHGKGPLTGDELLETRPVASTIATPSADPDLPLAQATATFERTYLESLMVKTAGNVTQAARIAGVARSTLREKLRRYGFASGSTPSPRALGD